jgi:hypothetical protein
MTSEEASRRQVELNPDAGSAAAPEPAVSGAVSAAEPVATKKSDVPAAKKTKKAAEPKPEPEPKPEVVEEHDPFAEDEAEAVGIEEIEEEQTEEDAEETVEDVPKLDDLLSAFPKFVKAHQRDKDDELGRKKGLFAAKQILESVGAAKVSDIQKKDWGTVYKKLTAPVKAGGK